MDETVEQEQELDLLQLQQSQTVLFAGADYRDSLSLTDIGVRNDTEVMDFEGLPVLI